MVSVCGPAPFSLAFRSVPPPDKGFPAVRNPRLRHATERSPRAVPPLLTPARRALRSSASKEGVASWLSYQPRSTPVPPQTKDARVLLPW